MRPIFAIPGNHDGAVFKGESAKSLDAFVANFCTSQPTRNSDSQGAVRTTMDQPGVYFTLNAPFVKFIGLYSNTGEGGTEGVIADPKVGDAQLIFLEAATRRGKSRAGQRSMARIDHRHTSSAIYGQPAARPQPDHAPADRPGLQ